MEPHYGQMMGNGRYHLTHKIGGGGMATVYLAQDKRLGTHVVVKKNSQSQTLADRQQFEAEATVMVKIGENPDRPISLPIVRDYFIESDGGQYLVMQYIEGEDLCSLVQRTGALDEKVVLYWLAQLLDALEFLHQQTPPIIHCDIKPHNIRVNASGDRAYLVDFGIANGRGGYGTPGYAPLEQYGGKVSTQSDIYALGATLYVLLSGTAPDAMFPADQLEDGSVSMPLLVNKISAELRTVVAKAMALKKTARYQTIAEMRQALQPLLPTALNLPVKQKIQTATPRQLNTPLSCAVRETAFWFVNAQRRPVRLALGHPYANQLLPIPMVLAHGPQIEFWQLAAWQQPGLLQRPLPPAIHSDDVTAVAVDKNGRFAVTASRDHKIQLWDLITRQPKPSSGATSSWIRALAFSPSGDSVTGIGENQQILRWSLRQPTTPQILGSDVNGRALTFSPDGRWLIVVGEQNRAWVQDEQTGTITDLTIPGNSIGEWLQTAVFHPGGTLLAVGGSGGSIHFLQTTDGKSPQMLPPQKWTLQSVGSVTMGRIYTLAMSPDGRFLAAAGADKYLYIFDTMHGRLINQPFPLDAPGLSLQFGATWQYLVLGMSNGRVSLLWLY